MYFVDWLCLVHGEEVCEEVHRHFRHLLPKRAQDEKRGDGGTCSTKRPNRDGGFAADAARITDEKAGSEDRKHASGGVLLQ